MLARSRGLSALTLLVLLLVATACGGGSHPAARKTPSRRPSPTSSGPTTPTTPPAPPDFAHLPASGVVAAARKSALATTTLHVTGRVRDTVGPSSFDVHVDLATDRHGHCSGSVDGAGAVDVLLIGHQAWFHPDVAYWAAALAVAKDTEVTAQQVSDYVGDRYIATAKSDVRQLRRLCDIGRLLGVGRVDGGLPFTARRQRIHHVPTVRLSHTAEGTDSTAAYVRIAAPHDVLRIERSVGGRREELDFHAPVRHPEALRMKAPTGDDLFNTLDEAIEAHECTIFLGCVEVVSTDDLEDAITEQVTKAGHKATDVTCPHELPGRVDARTTCTARVDGRRTRVKLRVTSIDGSKVFFDILLPPMTPTTTGQA